MAVGSVAREAGICTVVALILLFLTMEWLVVPPYGRFNVSYYEEQADAFLAGQTYLLRAPPPAMLALPDPWDPAANARFREPPDFDALPFPGVMDLSLYQGRLYLQWGPVPSLVLIPLRWFTGPGVQMGRLALIVETLSVLAYAGSAFLLARLCAIPVGGGIGAVLFLQFLVCPSWLFVLDRSRVYEIGICFGQFCMSFALLSAVIAFDQRLRRGISRPWLLVLSSVLLGCLVNCRLGLAPFGLAVPVVWYAWLKIHAAPLRSRQAVGAAVALGLPAACLLFGALAYNQLRFGSIFEVGQTWQLWGGHSSMWQKKLHFLVLARLVPNIWYYFLSPLQISFNRSLLLIPSSYPPSSWMSPELLSAYDIYADRMSGLFVMMPMVAVLLALPFGLFRAALWRGAERGRVVVAILLLCAVLSAFPLFLAPPSMRYGAEWCMWLLMAAALVVCQLRRLLAEKGWRAGRALFDAGIVLSTLWSAWVGASFLL